MISLRVDLDVGRLALEAAGDLVDQDLRVRQRHPLALGAAGQQQRAHAHRDADADRLHVGLDVLHRVVDREPRVHRPAGRVDVHRDVLVGVLGLEVDQLGDDEVGDVLGDRGAEEDDPLVEQPRVDVEGALAARGLLDHHRDQGAVADRSRSLIGRAVYRRPRRPAGEATQARRHGSEFSRPDYQSLPGVQISPGCRPARATALARAPCRASRSPRAPRPAPPGSASRPRPRASAALRSRISSRSTRRARSPQPLEQLLGSSACLRRAQRLEQVVVGDLDRPRPRRSPPGWPRAAASARRRASTLSSISSRPPSCTLRNASGSTPGGRGLEEALQHSSARAGDELVRDLDARAAGGRVHRGLAELLVGAAARRPRRSATDLVAQLGERVELRGLGGEVVVEVGQLLLAHLLDRDRELAVLPASSSAR